MEEKKEETTNQSVDISNEGSLYQPMDLVAIPIEDGETYPLPYQSPDLLLELDRLDVMSRLHENALAQVDQMIPIIPEKKMEKPKGTKKTTRKTVKKRFRLNAQKLYLTYPQCSLSKEDVLFNVKKHFGSNLVWAVVGQESHQDGSPHLHCAISLSKKVNITSAKTLDCLANYKHGNYQAMRKPVRCLEYCTKDKNYIAHGINVLQFLKSSSDRKSTKSDMIATKIMDGETLDNIKKAEPGFYMMHMDKIQKFASVEYIRIERSKKLPWPKIDYTDSENPETQMIVSWLIDNVRKHRPFRSKQLYIFGTTCLGKSSFVNTLEKYLNIYIMPTEDFYSDWVDNLYDICVMDEFKGQKTIQFLNQWLDGSTVYIRTKGGNTYKRHNIPTIIVANFSPQEVYHRVDAVYIAALVGRLEIVNVLSPINLPF